MASLLISSNYLLLPIKRNNKLLLKPILLINNTILKILKIINTDPAIIPEPVIITLSPIIIIIIFRSYILYIRDPNTAYRSIYQRNKRLKRLDLRIEISISLDSEILIILINTLVIFIYNILLKLKIKEIIRVIRKNSK